MGPSTSGDCARINFKVKKRALNFFARDDKYRFHFRSDLFYVLLMYF